MSLSSCSFLSFPNTSMSSIRHRVPSTHERTVIILFWKCSGVLEMPKGILLKQYLPNGVMKAVRSFDSLVSGICQNPLLASGLLKIVAPESCARVSSTFGTGWTS